MPRFFCVCLETGHKHIQSLTCVSGRLLCRLFRGWIYRIDSKYITGIGTIYQYLYVYILLRWQIDSIVVITLKVDAFNCPRIVGGALFILRSDRLRKLTQELWAWLVSFILRSDLRTWLSAVYSPNFGRCLWQTYSIAYVSPDDYLESPPNTLPKLVQLMNMYKCTCIKLINWPLCNCRKRLYSVSTEEPGIQF